MTDSDYMRDAITSLPTDVLQSMLNGARDAFVNCAPYVRGTDHAGSVRASFYYGYVAATIEAHNSGHKTDEWAQKNELRRGLSVHARLPGIVRRTDTRRFGGSQ